MTLPLDLILVRHGESQGNVAMAAAKAGDESYFTDEYVTTPGRLWRLTATGEAQARCSGAWLREQFAAHAFGNDGAAKIAHFVSPLVRTRQTAGQLGLAGEPRWRLNRSIRERDWGDIETITKKQFKSTFPLSAVREATDPLYWRPPGGESIADVADLRVRNFLDTLHREHSNDVVVAVAHGEWIRAAHLVLIRGNDETYSQWEEDKSLSVKNCEIFHYSRITPHSLATADEPAGTVQPRLTYFRRARPVSGAGGFEQAVGAWERINFKTYTNDELLSI